MEFKLFTYDYYLKMIHKIVPRNFKVGIADYEDLYQELLIYILSVEDKLITNKVEVYRDLESYMFTQVFHRCKRLINQLTKRKTFVSFCISKELISCLIFSKKISPLENLLLINGIKIFLKTSSSLTSFK